MEELVIVYVVEARKDLEEYTLDAGAIEASMIACFHELVEIAIHVFHHDMEFPRQRIEEDVQRRYQMWMDR